MVPICSSLLQQRLDFPFVHMVLQCFDLILPFILFSPSLSPFPLLLSHHLAILEFGFGGDGHVRPHKGILEGAEFLRGREGGREGKKEQRRKCTK